jgi:hypothetical protein
MTDQKEGLILTVKLPALPAARSRPCRVQAILANSGPEAVLVNRRMALGYRDHVARELYADLLEAGSRKPAKYREVDYEREFSPPSDYIALAAGQEISSTFDLFKFYKPDRPGAYELTLHYQADEELAQTPDGIVKGVVSSEPVHLLVD